jgi:hypothetical protein
MGSINSIIMAPSKILPGFPINKVEHSLAKPARKKAKAIVTIQHIIP